MAPDSLTNTKVEDFYTVLTQHIEAQEFTQAVEMVLSLHNLADQSGILSRLTDALADILANTRSTARDRALIHALDLTRDLALALARTLALVRDLVFSPDRALVLETDLDLASDLIRGLNRDLTHSRAFDRSLDRALTYLRAISMILRRLFEPHGEEILPAIEENSETIRLLGIGILTPETLSTQLAPYLQAINDFQIIVTELENDSPHPVRLRSISQNSPTDINLDGASETIKTIKEDIIPWRKEHAQHLAQIEIGQKELEKEQAEVSVLEARAKARQSQKYNELELDKKRAEIERMRLKNEKMRLDIQKEQIELAISVIEKLAPSLPETERLAYVMKILKPLQLLVHSPLEIDSSTSPNA